MKKILAIAMAALTLLAVGCSKPAEEVITIETVNTPAPVVTPNVPEVTPTPEVFVPSYTEKIAAKKAKNDETIGWIAIPGTVIDFPIMFDTKGGLGYYKLNDEGKESELGSVYAHFNIASADSMGVGQNLIVTAHNNRVAYAKGNYANGFFHELHHIQSVNTGKTNCGFDENDRTCPVTLDAATLPNFSTPEGRIWEISFDGIDAEWEVWAMYEVKEDEPESTLYYNTWWPTDYDKADYEYEEADAAFIQKWIDKQISRSEYAFGTTPAVTDQFMTIYTCGDNHDSKDAQSRLYFFLRQVNPVSTKFGGGAAEAAPQA